MHAKLLIAAVTLTCLTAPSIAVGQQPAASTMEKDIIYGKAGDQELRLDLVRPTSGKRPFPLVIWIHGGGWVMGDRQGYDAAMRDMAKLGYAGASVQYRLAPAHPFPAQLDDLRQALAFLRANAAKYDLDPARIVVTGASAGGHLSLMLGLAREGEGKSVPPVRGIIDVMGPTDFRTWKINQDANDLMRRSIGVDLDGLLVDFIGTSDRQDRRIATASPLTYVRGDNPPVLIIHGTADTWVPFQQAQVLHDALKNAGVKVRLAPLEGASHFDIFWPPGQREKQKQETAQFLKEVFEQK